MTLLTLLSSLPVTLELSLAIALAAPPLPTYVFTQAPRYQPKAWTSGQDRFPDGATIFLARGTIQRPLLRSFFATADPFPSFDGTRVLFAGKATAADPWQIWEVPVAGGLPKRLTKTTQNCLRPLFLPDGRVAYTRVTPSDAFIEVIAPGVPVPSRLTYGPARVLAADVLRDGRILFESASTPTSPRELYTVYPDGTGVAALRCDHGPDRSEARQVPSGDIVFRAAEDLARFTSSLATQSDLSTSLRKAAGPVASVSADVWLVSILNSTGRYGLQLHNTATGQSSPLTTPAEGNAVQPAVVAPRTPPRRFPSALVATRTAGTLLCLDARASRVPANTAAVHSIRFFTQDENGATVPLGVVPLDPDGSFYVQLPAERPLRLAALDANGATIQQEHGWFWMKPSEQRVCVGCHTGPERSPENKVPDVLLRTTTPANLTEILRQTK